MPVNVGNAWNLNRALNSQSYAYKAWVNYNYESNTMGIPADDMKQVTQTWSTELSNWEANYSEDENAYEIDDDDWNAAYDEGKTSAEETSGNDGNNQAYDTTGSAVGTAAVGATAIFGGKVVGNMATSISRKMFLSGKIDATTHCDNTVRKGSWMVTAPLSMAIGALYFATRPNRDELDALRVLKSVMTEQQGTLATSQETLADLSDSIMELSEGAEALNDDYEGDIEDRQKELEMVLELYYEIIERVESGEPISEEDRKILEAVGEVIPELQDELADLQGEAADSVGSVYDEIEGTQSQFDAEAETMANVQGTTDFTAGFDKATQARCIVEGVMQAANVGTGTVAAVQAGIAAANSLGTNAYAWACVGMGTAGAVMSGIGAVEQFKWAKEIGDMIDNRQVTEGVNVETQAVYEASLDNMVTYAEITGEIGTDIDDGTALEDITGDIEDYTETAEGVEIPEETPPEEGGEGETTPGATSTPGATTPGTTTTSTPQGGAGAGAGAPTGGVHTTSATAPGGSTGGAPGTSGGNTNTTFGTRTGFGGATASTKGAGAPSPTPNPTPTPNVGGAPNADGAPTPNTNGAGAPNNPFTTSAPNNPFATNAPNPFGPQSDDKGDDNKVGGKDDKVGDKKDDDKVDNKDGKDEKPDDIDNNGKSKEAESTPKTSELGESPNDNKNGEEDPRKKNPFA